MSDDIDEHMREAVALSVLMTRLQQERSYPPESFAPHIGFQDGRFVDLAVFNDSTGSLLAAFETKMADLDQTRATVALRQSLQFLASDARGALLFGLLLLKDGGNRLYRYNGSDALEPIEFEDIPSYQALTGAVVARKSAAVERSKRSVRKTIAAKSYLFGGAAGLLSVAALLGWWVPTWELLALMAAACMLVMLPELSHFKLLGLEVGLLTSEMESGAQKGGAREP